MKSLLAHAADVFGFDALERAVMVTPLAELAAVAVELEEGDRLDTVRPPAGGAS